MSVADEEIQPDGYSCRFDRPGDFESMRVFKPRDATTNPSLIFAANRCVAAVFGLSAIAVLAFVRLQLAGTTRGLPSQVKFVRGRFLRRVIRQFVHRRRGFWLQKSVVVQAMQQRAAVPRKG